MPQFARPSTDTTRESYTDEAGGTTNIYTKIDETTADDNDYIKSAAAPTSDVYVTKLTSVEDPVASTGHIIRYRYRKSAASGAQIDLTAQLRQGYVSEGTLGTQIATYSHTNVSDAWTTTTQTLSGGEADSITNYADLFLRFVFNQV